MWAATTTDTLPMWLPSGPLPCSSYSVPQATKNALGHFCLYSGGHEGSGLPRLPLPGGERETARGVYLRSRGQLHLLGGIMKLDPSRVQMDDGPLSCCCCGCSRRPSTCKSLIAAISRMVLQRPPASFSAMLQQVTVTTVRICPWSLDGEYPSAPCRAAGTPRCHP